MHDGHEVDWREARVGRIKTVYRFRCASIQLNRSRLGRRRQELSKTIRALPARTSKAPAGLRARTGCRTRLTLNQSAPRAAGRRPDVGGEAVACAIDEAVAPCGAAPDCHEQAPEEGRAEDEIDAMGP